MDHLLGLIPNLDALTLTLATALATGLIAGLRGLFALLRKLAARTTTAADDKLVDETESAVRDQSKDI